MGRITGIFLLSGALGVLALQQLAELPGWGLGCLGFGLFLFAAALWMRARPWLAWGAALVAGIVAGFGWAEWRAEWRLQEALSPDWEGRDIRLIGTVVSLPVGFERGQRFEFQVEKVETPEARLGIHVPRRLWLSHYTRSLFGRNAGNSGNAGKKTAAFRVGERWALTVRLKRPRGTINPGGFDYESWLLERNLRATGYIRANPAPEHLADPVIGSPMLVIHRLRQAIKEAFLSRLGDAPYAGILVALAIGDQQATPNHQWMVFNRTGTTHLMSISGLHVTLVGILAGWLLNRLWRFFPRLCLRLPAPKAAILGGCLAAFAYALLAGFGIPAQRTCFMLAVAALALLSGRRVGGGRILLLALTGVLLLDPWAVLAPGFWLSFGAVAALIWIGLHGASAAGEEDAGGGFPPNWRQRLSRWGWRGLREFCRTQWAATLATLPVLVWVFQQFPLSSPLANLLAIPLVSFVITPLALIAALFAWIPGLPLLDVAHGLLAWLMVVLESLASWPLWQPPAPELWAVALASLGVFMLLLPRGLPGRGAGVVLILPLLFWPPPRIAPGHLRVTALDVGQGQAVLLETAQHRLLYDAGPSYGSDNDSDDAGRRIVLPYLVHRGVDALDMMVVSHRDTDHSGGMKAIQEAMPVRRLSSSVPEYQGGEFCAQGMSWVWDDVRFEFLHPPSDRLPKGDNGDSCVLKATTATGSLLLTGDIDKRAENILLTAYAATPASLSADVILAPHHGSRNSSSEPFIAAVRPKIALFSAGYRNRYNHPHPDALQRYRALEAQLWRTDRDGALTLEFSGEGIKQQAWRQEKPRYWQER
jgi:competence protein ComEC